MNERTLVSSTIATYPLQNFTAIATAEPITIGVAHSDYSDAEIEEVIENAGSWDPGNKIAQGQAKRLVRTIGTFDTPQSVEDFVALNDGRTIKTKLNWMLNTGDGLQYWAYNAGAAAVGTTVPVIRMQGHANLWLK